MRKAVRFPCSSIPSTILYIVIILKCNHLLLHKQGVCKTHTLVKRKKLDVSLAKKNGWKSKMNFSKALDKTIKDFKKIY